MQVTTIGLDIAKNVFQVHGIDAAVIRPWSFKSSINAGLGDKLPLVSVKLTASSPGRQVRLLKGQVTIAVVIRIAVPEAKPSSRAKGRERAA